MKKRDELSCSHWATEVEPAALTVLTGLKGSYLDHIWHLRSTEKLWPGFLVIQNDDMLLFHYWKFQGNMVNKNLEEK